MLDGLETTGYDDCDISHLPDITIDISHLLDMTHDISHLPDMKFDISPLPDNDDTIVTSRIYRICRLWHLTFAGYDDCDIMHLPDMASDISRLPDMTIDISH